MTTQIKSPVAQSVAKYYDEYGWKKKSEGIGEDVTFRQFSPAFRAYSDASTARVLALATAGATGSILFVGGGDMPESHRALAQQFETVTCLDVSQAGIDLAREKLGERAAYVVESIVETTLADDSFDFVYCAHVLYHIGKDEQEAAVRQMLRLTKPGGRLVVVYSNPHSPFRLPGRLLEMVQAVLGKGGGVSGRNAPSRLYYYSYPLSWWGRFRSAARMRLEPWEVVVGRFAHTLLKSRVLEARFFAAALWLEKAAPGLAARLWHFPMIVFDKPEG